MKYVKQLGIILGVCLLGELLKYGLPFPIPSSVYGMLLLLLLLKTKGIHLEQVEDTADFLVQAMPVMFVPAAVGLMDVWQELVPTLLPMGIIVVATTALVMAVTGHVAQWMMKHTKEHANE